MIAAEAAASWWTATGYGVLLGAGVALASQAVLLCVQIVRDRRARNRSLQYDTLAWEAATLVALLDAMAAFSAAIEELVDESDRIVMSTPLLPGEERDFPDPIYAIKARARERLTSMRTASVQVPHDATRDVTSEALRSVMKAVFGADAVESIRLSANTRDDYLAGVSSALEVFDDAYLDVGRRHREVRNEMLAVGQK